MRIIVTKNYQELSKVAAELVIKQIKKKTASVLGLATGNTPAGIYKELVRDFKAKKVSFRKVKTFNLDEYLGLGRDNPASFFYYMRKNFFCQVDIKPENIHMLDGQAQNLEKECINFEKTIKKNGGIDLQILGIGLDGHIAFDEPPASPMSKTRVVKLALSTRRANKAAFGNDTKKVPKKALTMGIATILKARRIILLAAGKSKAEVAARALQGKINGHIPASFLQEHPDVTVVLDKAAAGKLKLPH